MDRMQSYFLLSIFVVMICADTVFVLANENSGNNNSGANGGNGNTGSNSGNNNTGVHEGNGNSGDSSGNGNSGPNSGNGNSGNHTGNDNSGADSGNGNKGNDDGNGNKGGNNGNGNTGNSNGNANNGSSNGNANSGNNNGNGNNGNGNGNGNSGNHNGNGNGNNSTNNGNGNSGDHNGNGNIGGSDNGNGNDGSYNGNGNNGTHNGNGNGGNHNGNGNSGNENGNGNIGNDNGNGNNGSNNGNGNSGSHNGNGKIPDDGNKNYESGTSYKTLTPLASGQERAFCDKPGTCYYQTLVCPAQCPERKPKKNKKFKGCFVDCTRKCEATCKWRKANCNGYGSLCYDPRFIGGDGTMFYFHGSKGGNFAIVSDDNLQINAHFIGTRPQGRTRDFTWVQALSIMFDSHNLVIAAKRVAHWDDNLDSLVIKWDGEDVIIPNDEESEWSLKSEKRKVIVERTDETNSLHVTVSGLVDLDIKVRPIGQKENIVHRYQLPKDDSFAHLETQLMFKNLSDLVEGVLGKTYRPDYVSPVKTGVAMPMMGGEDKYQTPSLFSHECKLCRFKGQSEVAAI